MSDKMVLVIIISAILSIVFDLQPSIDQGLRIPDGPMEEWK